MVVVGDRPGPGDALTPVAGVPMVVHAVRALLATGLVGHVTVLADARRPLFERACSADPVVVHATLRQALSGIGAHIGQRPGATGSDAPVTTGIGEIVLLHDALRPLAPAALAAAVVEAVQGGHPMAVPVLPLADTVKLVDDRGVVTGTPDRSVLRVLQTPVAARADLVPAEVGDPLAVVRRYAAAGGAAHTVPGHPAAFAVRSGWALELAELVAEGTISL